MKKTIVVLIMLTAVLSLTCAKEKKSKAKNVIENIVRDLQEYYPETKAKLETIEFNKFIDLED